jgi:DNA-directed RNA polymerase subunit omega
MATPRQPSMMEPPIEDLLQRVDSKFTLVSLSAKRARQINSYFNQLGEGLGAIVPPQVTSVSRKSLSIALEEVVSDKIVPVRIEPVGEEAEEGSSPDGGLGSAESAGEATEAGEGD